MKKKASKPRRLAAASTPRIRPTPADLLNARNGQVSDLIREGLDVLFCGINPSLYSAALNQHFARPGNRFWPALHLAGFTDRLLLPSEGDILLASGCGITNVVARATARADELEPHEFVEGAVLLRKKIARYRPRFLAVLGIGAYRSSFAQPKATWGLQSESLGSTRVWVLPNPSGLNANFQIRDLAKMFGELKTAR